MTLTKVVEALARRNTPMKKGDFEFVRGPDGINHLLIVAIAGPKLQFFNPCQAFIPGEDPGRYEVVDTLTCMRCQAR